MIIGILNVTLLIQKSNSLKDKRVILSSLKARLRRQFNISLIESDAQDKWQKSVLSIVNVGGDKRSVNQIINQIINFIERDNWCQVLDYNVQLI